MVKINKVYTRQGDSGFTSLAGGQRVQKTNKRVRVLGALDELNSFAGLARTTAAELNVEIADSLALIQNVLFDIGAEIALISPETPAINDSDLDNIENEISKLTESQSELNSFVLPGGNLLNSQLHICRSVCRRAELEAWELNETETLNNNLLIYINRLSDYFFALARQAGEIKGSKEYLWIPRSRNSGSFGKN